MAKRILAMVLVLTMAVSLMPSVVFAEGVAATAHAGQHAGGSHVCESCGESTWQAWPTDGTVPTEGHYYLTQNVTMTGSVKVLDSKKLHICLDGYVLTAKSGTQPFSTEGAAELATMDCTAYTEGDVYHAGAITGGKTTSGTNAGGVAFIRRNGTFKLYDGILTGNSAAGNIGGGALGTQAKSGTTPGGKIYIYGGEISGNTAAKTGGAIYLNTDCELYISGGTIKGNTGTYGGAIDAGRACKVEISGGTITGNTATDDGGGINAAARTCNITFSGDVTITGNKKGTAENNVRLGNTGNIKTGTLEAASRIGVTLGATKDRTFSAALAADYSANFASDDAAYAVGLNSDNKLVLTDPPALPAHSHCLYGGAAIGCDHAAVEYVKWDDSNSLPDSGSYYLTADVTVPAQVSVNGKLDLCLNGHTVTVGSDAGRAYYLSDNDTLNISDCKGGGKLTGATKGAILSNASGKNMQINLYGGIITQNTSGSGGGVVVQGDCVFHMYGGKISGNTATQNGGGIYVGANSAVSVSGGEISGNSANYGGAIDAGRACTVTLTGGTVTDNTATSDGGGINAASSGCKLTLSGEPVILGNTAGQKASNVRLGNSGMLTVDTMGSKASIGVTAGTNRAISGQTNDYSKRFISDDTRMVVIYKDNALFMGVNSDHKHCLCGGAAATGCDHTAVEYVRWDDPNSLPDSGSYYLTVDVTVPAQVSVAGRLDLCLNGHTVTVGSNGGRVCYLSDNDTLNISDCKGGGKLTGATKGAILTNRSGSNMQLNLYGGSITGNDSTDSGGGLTVQGDCVFNLYGGSITGNTATSVLTLDENGSPKLDADGDQTHSNSRGGGMYLGSGAVFNMYGGEISGNKATAVEYKKAGATAASVGGGNAGGIAVYGTANLYGGEISGNSAQLGGGIFTYGKNAVANLQGTAVTGNTAVSGGGGISQGSSTINLISGTVSGNAATNTGAGLYISTGTALKMTGGTITGNTATNDGGGLFVLAAEANLAAGTVSGNQAVDGAGIYGTVTTASGEVKPSAVTVGERVQITGNRASGNGGGILLRGTGSKLTMNGGEISNNQAKNAGGVLIETRAGFFLNGGKISSNRVTAGGGGVYISTDTQFEMTGGTISGNSAPKSIGGGLYLLRSQATLRGGSISGNVAQNGGGILVRGAKLTIYNAAVTGNTATGETVVKDGQSTQSGGNGGGIFIGRAGYKKNGVQYYATPVVNIHNVYVANNTSHSSAAGILVQSKGTVFNMYGGTVTGNSTENGSGGGIYFSSNTRNTVTGGTISQNKAKNAAGIFLSSTSSLANLKVHDNEALNASGGITVSGKSTTVDMKNMEIYNNTAVGPAGALVVQSSATLHLDGAKIYGNKAGSTSGAIYFSNPGYGNLKNVELYENQTQMQGGAMYVGTNSRVNADNLTVRDNTADQEYGGGIYNRGRLVITNSKILNNTVKNGCGGGIGTFKVASTLLADDAGVFAENCIISGNQAGLQGGGLNGHRGCPVYLTDCVVTDNTAGAEGGGLHVDGKMSLHNVTVTGNHSGGEGYAVYLMPSLFDGHSYQTGYKKISGDVIIRDNENGDMYLGGGTALAVAGKTLGEKAHVELTLYSGVLSQWVMGVYNYEGGDRVYTLTAGDRSVTDPEPVPAEAQKQEPQGTNTDILLYAGAGVLVVVAAAVVLLLLRKKKAKAAAQAEKE